MLYVMLNSWRNILDLLIFKLIRLFFSLKINEKNTYIEQVYLQEQLFRKINSFYS